MRINILIIILFLIVMSISVVACTKSNSIEIKRYSEWKKNRVDFKLFDEINNDKKNYFPKYLHDKKGHMFEKEVNQHNVTFFQTESLCFFLIGNTMVEKLNSLIEEGVRQSYPVIIDIDGDDKHEILLVLEYEEGVGLLIFSIENHVARILYELPISSYQFDESKTVFILKHLNDDNVYDIRVRGDLFYAAGYNDMEEGFYEADKDVIDFYSESSNNNLIYKIANKNEIKASEKNSLEGYLSAE